MVGSKGKKSMSHDPYFNSNFFLCKRHTDVTMPYVAVGGNV